MKGKISKNLEMDLALKDKKAITMNVGLDTQSIH